MMLAECFGTYAPAFEGSSWMGNNVIAKAYTKNYRTDKNGQPGHNRPQALQLAQWYTPMVAFLCELTMNQAAQDIVRVGVRAIGNNGGNIATRWSEQSNRCSHRETMNDNLVRNGLWLASGNLKRRFQIAYFSIASARHYAI